MKVSFFSRQFVESLKANASENLARYLADPNWAERAARDAGVLHESERVAAPPPRLAFGEGREPERDAENARLVHTWLGDLPSVVAMDERLWAWAAHTVFAAYMQARWPVESANTVNRRYLFEGSSFASLTRHGIARLWWAAHLTHDSGRSDPYELTDVLFHRQDVHVSLLERSLGKCDAVRRGVLEFLRDGREALADESYGRRIQVLLRELNLYGGAVVLDALTPAEITLHLRRSSQLLFPKPG